MKRNPSFRRLQKTLTKNRKLRKVVLGVSGMSSPRLSSKSILRIYPSGNRIRKAAKVFYQKLHDRK